MFALEDFKGLQISKASQNKPPPQTWQAYLKQLISFCLVNQFHQLQLMPYQPQVYRRPEAFHLSSRQTKNQETSSA